MITLVLCDIESRIHVDVQRHSKFREAVPVGLPGRDSWVLFFAVLVGKGSFHLSFALTLAQSAVNLCGWTPEVVGSLICHSRPYTIYFIEGVLVWSVVHLYMITLQVDSGKIYP